ncbi:collectin-12-like [Haliotis rubra]|uniref:collectin-12-like n=1 Tax=Haliotis rubra TaxID=36100 RepID=UPI001EE52150|nr:collectin-12-like [Haliotis rubra]
MLSKHIVDLQTGFVFFLLTLVCEITLGSHTCGTEERILTGKYLQDSNFGHVKGVSLFRCAAECLSYSICRSFNFNNVTRLCSLNFEDNERRPELITDDLFNVYSNIKGWPQLISGPCKEKECGTHEKCTVTRLGTPTCENSGLYGRTYTSQFIVSTNKLTWNESVEECSETYETLAIVNTASRYEQATRAVEGKGTKDFVWLGASDRKTEGTWTWVDGQPMGTDRWARHDNQPNNFNEQDCLAYKVKNNQSNRWYDNSCSNKHYFMCEKYVLLK